MPDGTVPVNVLQNDGWFTRVRIRSGVLGERERDRERENTVYSAYSVRWTCLLKLWRQVGMISPEFLDWMDVHVREVCCNPRSVSLDIVNFLYCLVGFVAN